MTVNASDYAREEPPTPQQLARQIRNEIARKGIDARQLAKEVGIAEASMSRYLRCERTMSIKTLGNIAAALGLTFVELLVRAATVEL